MSYSNRPSRRPDPTIAPILHDPVTGKLKVRPPFMPSARQEAMNERRQRRIKANKAAGYWERRFSLAGDLE